MSNTKDAFSTRDEEFVTNLKWGLWNEVWSTANSSLACEIFDAARRKRYLQKASEDAARANDHYEKALALQVHAPATIAGLRKVAVAAGQEAFRSGMSNIPVAAKFVQEVASESQVKCAGDSLGEQAWPLFLSMVCTMAQVVSADVLKDRNKSRQYKDSFKSASDRFEAVLCEVLVRARQTSRIIQEKTALARSNMPYSSQLRPKQRSHWTDQESELVERTGGLFVPKVVPRDCGKDRVSVLTPTVEKRQRFHELLWSCFQAQTWPNKEFVVVETYQGKPSDFFLKLSKKDPRLVYTSFRVNAWKDDDWSIGFKRNLGAAMATGDIIAHFDDDDLYAPDYLTTMVNDMVTRSCMAITLSSWHIFEMCSQSFGYCNPSHHGSMEGLGLRDPSIRQLTYGYGFSYVYKRETVLELPYKDINMGEDYEFLSMLIELYGQHCVALMEDKYGLCLHTQHGGNTSRSFALFKTPEEQVRDLDFFHFYPVFDWYRQLAEEKVPTRSSDDDVEDTFAFAICTNSPFRRSRNVTVHTKTSKLECTCSVGATLVDLLQQLKKQSASWPDGAIIFRTPPPSIDVSEHQRRAWMRKSLEIMCPIAPPIEDYLASNVRIDERLKHLLGRVTSPLDDDDVLGAKTTDLWAVWPDIANCYPRQ